MRYCPAVCVLAGLETALALAKQLVAEDGEMSAEEEGEGSGPKEDASYFGDFGLGSEDVHEEADDSDD